MRFRASILLFSLPALAQSVTYSTYLRDHFSPSVLAADAAGDISVAGTATVDPLVPPPVPFVMKLDAAGQNILYSRFLGGSSGDSVAGIALDSAGNAYIVGTTFSPDFPATPGRAIGTLPTGPHDPRAFLTELDPQGGVLFSETIGQVSNVGLAVAVTAQGQLLVSGESNAKGFAATTGAYSVADTTNQAYLMELSPDGSRVIFSATGIGGSALALDAAGDIFMAGSTTLTDYPTTPGAYQTKFQQQFVCFGFCQISFLGTNQYVTKVDPAATKLLYSTGVGGKGSTTNNGLAVDAAGNAYVTGTISGNYPFTVPPPAGVVSVQAFLTKLDPAGAQAIYSIPVGGAGVAVSGNTVFAGGSYDSVFYGIGAGLPLAGLPPGVASLNGACQVNNFTTGSQTYVAQVDATTGKVLDTVLVDATDSATQGITLVGDSAVWLAGTTGQADVVMTPGAIAPRGLTQGVLPGAAVAKIDFSQAPAAGSPQLGCVLDGANLVRVGPVAPNQLITLMGADLDSATITFDGQPVTPLYTSASQINVAVPYAVAGEDFTQMEISNAAGSVARELPVTPSEPSLFVALSGQRCTPPPHAVQIGLPVVARNQDGSVNTCDEPAHSGSTVSLFLNGMGGLYSTARGAMPLTPGDIQVAVSFSGRSAEVVNVVAENDWVWRVDVLAPPVQSAENAVVNVIIGAPEVPIVAGPLTPELPVAEAASPGSPLPVSLWIAP